MAQQIKGYREALRELGNIDKNLQKQYKKDSKQILKPAVDAVRAAYPTGAPLSGLSRSWTDKGRKIAPWQAGQIRRSIRPAVYTRKTARTSLAIIVGSPLATIVEFAGAKTNNLLGDNLTAQVHAVPRFAWPAFERQRDAIRTQIMLATTEMTNIINRRLAR